MRLIDADALMTEFMDSDLDHLQRDDWKEVIQIVTDAPTITPEPHWIPVTERLPETDDEVLTTYIVNGNRKKRYVETSRYYDGFDGQWSSPWDEYRIAGMRIEVIAWMPLPEPYKGVTDDRD